MTITFFMLSQLNLLLMIDLVYKISVPTVSITNSLFKLIVACPLLERIFGQNLRRMQVEGDHVQVIASFFQIFNGKTLETNLKRHRQRDRVENERS